MKWSLNTYQTGQDWELGYLIDMVKKTGYHGIEFLMDYDQKHGLEWNAPCELWDKVKTKMDSASLEFASLTSCQNFHSLDENERRQSVERVKRVIDMANFFGCNHIRVLGDRFTDETRDTVVKNVGECLGELGKYAQTYNIVVSIEMHSSFTEPDPAMEAIQIADQENVGVVFNCVWPNVTMGTVDAFHDRIAPHVTMVHTHNVEDAKTFEFYRRMFKKLKEIGFDGYISNESAYRGPDPEKVLALNVALYRAFTGE
ncbi:MAG: sugar phosphate isomerase/epimerase family protein [Candidatus Poribacteria bacterium]